MSGGNAFLAEVNQLLIEHYGIAIEDTGYDEADWMARFGDLGNAEECVHAYAEKYDLINVQSNGFF